MSNELKSVPSRVDMPDEAIADLRRRVAATRLLSQKLVDDRSQTIGYALLDSPVAPAAWMLDHDTDSHNEISSAFLEGQPSGGLSLDSVADNITLYWLTGTGALGGLSYSENTQAAAHTAGQAPPEIKLPVGATTFPGEIFAVPRGWAEKAYPISPTSTRPAGAATSPPGRARLFDRDPRGVQVAPLEGGCHE